MIRNAFRFTLLGAVAAVLLCSVPVAAQTECAGPQTSHEVELTPELAVELGLPDPVEQTKDVKAVPVCRDDETLQVCDVTDPCTGKTFWDATCCPEGTRGSCLIGITVEGCITGVRAICLESI